MRSRLACLFLLLLLPFSTPALGKQATPEAAPRAITASDMIPSPLDFGLGWERARSYSPSFELDIFESTDGAAFVGPAGARILVFAWINAPSRDAVQASWAETTTWFDNYRGTLSVNTHAENVLEKESIPSGCADARRTQGDDLIAYLPAGVTLCSVDLTLTLLVVVMGTWNGVQHAEASDSVVLLIRSLTPTYDLGRT